MNKFIIPLGLFGLLVIFLTMGLDTEKSKIPSPLIGKSAPAFSLSDLTNPAIKISPDSFKGKVTIINIWASWCPECLVEHSILLQLQHDVDAMLLGINYKDEVADAKAWLTRYGNPYDQIAVDHAGDMAIDYGVYGVPETFILDKKGIIRFKQIGEITPHIYQSEILPFIKTLSSADE